MAEGASSSSSAGKIALEFEGQIVSALAETLNESLDENGYYPNIINGLREQNAKLFADNAKMKQMIEQDRTTWTQYRQDYKEQSQKLNDQNSMLQARHQEYKQLFQQASAENVQLREQLRSVQNANRVLGYAHGVLTTNYIYEKGHQPLIEYPMEMRESMPQRILQSGTQERQPLHLTQHPQQQNGRSISLAQTTQETPIVHPRPSLSASNALAQSQLHLQPSSSRPRTSSEGFPLQMQAPPNSYPTTMPSRSRHSSDGLSHQGQSPSQRLPQTSHGHLQTLQQPRNVSSEGTPSKPPKPAEGAPRIPQPVRPAPPALQSNYFPNEWAFMTNRPLPQTSRSSQGNTQTPQDPQLLGRPSSEPFVRWPPNEPQQLPPRNSAQPNKMPEQQFVHSVPPFVPSKHTSTGTVTSPAMQRQSRPVSMSIPSLFPSSSLTSPSAQSQSRPSTSFSRQSMSPADSDGPLTPLVDMHKVPAVQIASSSPTLLGSMKRIGENLQREYDKRPKSTNSLADEIVEVDANGLIPPHVFLQKITEFEDGNIVCRLCEARYEQKIADEKPAPFATVADLANHCQLEHVSFWNSARNGSVSVTSTSSA